MKPNFSFFSLPHNNHLGTPQELTDECGNVVWVNYEWAWGGRYTYFYQEQSLNGCAILEHQLQPIRFQGQSLDVETGLHYNRFRYYDSDVGMFIQRDPIGLLGGVNVFAYVPNPIHWIDPLGLATSLCDAMRELAATSDTNPFLNGNRFDPSKVSQEPIPSGEKPPDISVFTDHRNGLTYDTQYIQMGWSITKTHGAGSAVMANNGYMLAPLIDGTILKWKKGEKTDLSWFKGDNVPANMRGIKLGEFGAIHFKSFKDFVKDLCPQNRSSCTKC